ncbi:phosphoglycerate mutase family protein [Paenibacillus nasutitermitis]|uniref:Histidine phosphatase family protein n=1 Tax=Paenibacillus nasutitermitis TaxID=1652958 RepID=A0A916YUJ5_9BACL|nr:phosphoglycerate mutase family protein [Paenibacillus nasutitermitis]GGD61172.1 histidine phosphatase family protein [Paenibacillus nasutitermitis]
MDFIFIRHGHGEHLNDYPNRLNTLHPSLTEYGKFQVSQLRNKIKMDPDDLVLVSPTKRTIETYGDTEILDFKLDCWKEGINRIEQDIFEGFAKRLIDWIGESYKKIFIISHDGTITNYRILLGEKGLTRKDFLGEAGVYRMKL